MPDTIMNISFIALLLLLAGALLIGFAVHQQLHNQQRRQKLLQLQHMDTDLNKDRASGPLAFSVTSLPGNQNEQIAVVVQALKNLLAWLDGRFRLPPAQIVLARQAGFIHPGNEAGQASLVILGRYFWLSKMITAVIAAVWLWPEGQKALGYLLLIIAMVIANLIPEALFGLFCRDRARRLQGQLPQVFDLLALCLEAGLSIDAALTRIGEEMRAVNLALAKHFAALSDDLRITNSRSHAFDELARRLPLDDLRQLSWLIAQADDYGTPLAEGLRKLAGHSRTIHGLALEERMAKVPAQMSVPLMVFIILPLVALLAGPAFIMLIRQLSGEG